MNILTKNIHFLMVASFSVKSDAYSMMSMNAKQQSSNLNKNSSRRAFFSKASSIASAATFLSSVTAESLPASAIGPTRIDIVNPIYNAAPCPPSRPIPGEKAMKGMRGLCVTVSAELKDLSPKELQDVGIYGFVTDAITGDSVLANNPDLSTDAGQFAMVKSINTKDKKIEFDFVAAVPREKDITQFENGIGELSFQSLRIVDFPGGQQYGSISPCEMNEFSQECEDWETENGPYVKKEFMVKSNPRTKGQ